MRMHKGNFSVAQRRILSLLAVLLLNSSHTLEAATDLPSQGISPAKVADYVHAIVEADREIYTTQIVKRLQEQGLVLAREAVGKPAQPLVHVADQQHRRYHQQDDDQ